jgi:uncharacterized membrane protein YfcA
VPHIPAHLFNIGSLEISKARFLMVSFALLMLLTSLSMIRSRNKMVAIPGAQPRKMGPLFLQGTGVGAVTGLLGAGGGFLIIPALVLFGKLPMKIAIGSSLTIIAFSSLFGFFSTMGQYVIDWSLLTSFTGIAVAGIFIGSSLADKISPFMLKKIFGWFVLAMAVFILLKEMI